MKTKFKVLGLLAMLAILSSCSTYQKKLNKATLFFNQNPLELAKICSDKFPVVPVYIKGKTDTVAGKTIFIKGDSVKCPDGSKVKTEDRKVQCPSSTHSVDTVKVEDPAKVFMLGGLLKKAEDSLLIVKQDKKNLEDQLKLSKKANTTKLFIIIGMFVLFGGLIAWKFKSLFP